MLRETPVSLSEMKPSLRVFSYLLSARANALRAIQIIIHLINVAVKGAIHDDGTEKALNEAPATVINLRE